MCTMNRWGKININLQKSETSIQWESVVIIFYMWAMKMTLLVLLKLYKKWWSCHLKFLAIKWGTAECVYLIYICGPFQFQYLVNISSSSLVWSFSFLVQGILITYPRQLFIIIYFSIYLCPDATTSLVQIFICHFSNRKCLRWRLWVFLVMMWHMLYPRLFFSPTLFYSFFNFFSYSACQVDIEVKTISIFLLYHWMCNVSTHPHPSTYH